MKQEAVSKFTGGLLIVVPLLLITLFTILSLSFEYPDILRMPTGEVLARFRAGGTGLIAIWYAMTILAAFFIPMVLLVHKLLSHEDSPYMLLATTFGVVAGVVQMLGFIRWSLLVPYLTRVYFDPATSASGRETAALLFQVFNQYAGVAVGEHLGYLFTGLWTIFIGVTMLRSPSFKPWPAWTGIALALGIFLGMLEPAGITWAGTANFVAYTLWSLWLVALGVGFIRTFPVLRIA